MSIKYRPCRFRALEAAETQAFSALNVPLATLVLCLISCLDMEKQHDDNMKQSDKLTAYYVRAVHKTDILYLDNQMQRLLYHAAPNGYAALTAKGGERK